jgi:hypothetical protein
LTVEHGFTDSFDATEFEKITSGFPISHLHDPSIRFERTDFVTSDPIGQTQSHHLTNLCVDTIHFFGSPFMNVSEEVDASYRFASDALLETVEFVKTCTVPLTLDFNSQRYENSERFQKSILLFESNSENVSNQFGNDGFDESQQLIRTETIKFSIEHRLTDKLLYTISFNSTSLFATLTLLASTFFSSDVVPQSNVFTASEYLVLNTVDADRQSSANISLSLANGLLAVAAIVILTVLIILLVKRHRNRSTKTFDASLENSHELDHSELDSDDLLNDSLTEDLDQMQLSWNASSCDSLFADGDEIFSHRSDELF